MLTDSQATTEHIPATHAPVVQVSESANGGWDVRIEHEGEAPLIEHYSDWHRLERRRAILALPPIPVH
jgi:hypothetical protein